MSTGFLHFFEKYLDFLIFVFISKFYFQNILKFSVLQFNLQHGMMITDALWLMEAPFFQSPSHQELLQAKGNRCS